MRINNQKWKTLGRRIIVLLLLCGLLLPIGHQSFAASITYTYTWIKDKSGLPRDDQWHDYFIAWEDTDENHKWWFTDYHWFTANGYNNYDAGGSHWMEYKAVSTLPNWQDASFTSNESLGHMQIKYAGVDKDNNNSPKYYIRVSKMSGGYVYFTRYEPTNNENDADAFTFLDKGDVFHIFVNIKGKADRYLTRDGDCLETTESSSYGGGEYWRPLRVYQRTFAIQQTEEGSLDDMLGKVTLHEYHWVNTTEELMELANRKQWAEVLLAWEDAWDSGPAHNNPNKVWYTKEVWYDEKGNPNYRNAAGNEFYYWANDYIGSDGYARANDEVFILPTKVGHFQMKGVGWDSDNPVKGDTWWGDPIDSPIFQLRFRFGRNQYIYVGNNGFEEDPDDAENYTVQLFVEWNKKNQPEYYYGSVNIFVNMGGDDEYITRLNNRFDISNDNSSGYWEYPFRIYAYYPVEYDAIVKSFTIGKGASYCIDKQLILEKDVTITVEDGGVLVVDQQLLNNGNIVVNKGGTLVINEGGYIMAYAQDAQGSITLNGGNMIIMDEAKVICDRGEGTMLVRNGATILNRGVLMVSDALELRNNSYLKNESMGTVVLGGVMMKDRGNIANLNRDQILANLPVNLNKVVFLCSSKSKFWNYGLLSRPWWYEWHDESEGFVNKGEIRDNK